MIKSINNWTLFLFSLFKIPLLCFCCPRIKKKTPTSLHLYIPLHFFTKNHVGSMYFGVLMMGADLSAGLLSMHCAFLSNKKVSIIFKDTQADFLKRAEHGVLFCCDDGNKINQLIDLVISTQTRQHTPIQIQGFCSKTKEVVARFTLTLSLKAK